MGLRSCSTSSIDVCSAQTIFVDALAPHDSFLPSIAVREAPIVTSLRSLKYEDDGYQRSLRHYIGGRRASARRELQDESIAVLKEEPRYTLLMFEPNAHYLHWLIVDVAASALAAGVAQADGTTILPYTPPNVLEPSQQIACVVMLLRQPAVATSLADSTATSEIAAFYASAGHPLRSRHCRGHCSHRGAFDITQFKAFHRLTLSALTWFRVRYDAYEAFRLIAGLQATAQRNASVSHGGGVRTSGHAGWSRTKSAIG